MDSQDGTTSGPGRPPVGRELDLVGGRREFKIAGVTVAGRRRRPSGEAAPLPRNLRGAGTFWLISGALALAVWVMLFAIPSSTQWWTEQDYKVVSWLVERRTDTLTMLAKGLDAITSEWFLRVLRLGSLFALVFVKRWRHFFAALIAVLIVEGTTEFLQEMVGRTRPLVPILADWRDRLIRPAR